MAVTMPTDQYAPGGVVKVLANSVGVNSTSFNQYAPGGVHAQIMSGGGVALGTLDQRYAGGAMAHFCSMATGHTGATGMMVEGEEVPRKLEGPTGSSGRK